MGLLNVVFRGKLIIEVKPKLAMPVTGPGGLNGYEMSSIPNCIYVQSAHPPASL
jgi:hypothetical protein